MDEYMQYLAERIPEKDSLKLVKSEAEKYYKSHSLDDCFSMEINLYQSDNFQIQEVGVFLLGYSAHHNASALSFLRIWTSRPYFKDNPQIAIQILSAHREDNSEYVRKSVGNALRDISKKHPQMILEELNS